jgi:hypothetical protein
LFSSSCTTTSGAAGQVRRRADAKAGCPLEAFGGAAAVGAAGAQREPVAVELSTDGTMLVSYGPLKLGSITAHGHFGPGSRPRSRDSDPPAEDLSRGA